MTIDRDIVIFLLTLVMTIIGYILRLTRDSISSLGKRLGDLEQARAVTDSRHEAVVDMLKDMRESEKATAGVIADVYAMMNEIKVEMAKLSTRSERESNSGRG